MGGAVLPVSPAASAAETLLAVSAAAGASAGGLKTFAVFHSAVGDPAAAAVAVEPYVVILIGMAISALVQVIVT